MNHPEILHIDSIKKSFTRRGLDYKGNGHFEKFCVIDDFSIRIEKGKVTALIGGNGAGKTTLFNIISRFEKADSGSISYLMDGSTSEILTQNPFKIARLGIGRMFQDNHIFHEMTILENMLVADVDNFGEMPFYSLLFYKKLKLIEKRKTEKVREIFDQLFGKENSFWENRFKKASHLSYGEQRLLGLARLLMGDYKLLLLDEPTSGANPVIIDKIVKIIRDFVETKGKSVFLIEHNMKVVKEVADYCHFMSGGKLAASGLPRDILNNSQVRKTYMGY